MNKKAAQLRAEAARIREFLPWIHDADARAGAEELIKELELQATELDEEDG